MELRFQVNYLAGYLLARELSPPRVVNVASAGQAPIDFDDPMITRGYSGTRAYGQSKLAQIMSGFELAGRISATEITVNSLHPATYMPTKIVLAEVGSSIDTLQTGVAATYRLVSDPGLDGVTGQFFNKTHTARAHRQAYDRNARAELWNRSLQLTGEPDIATEPGRPG